MRTSNIAKFFGLLLFGCTAEHTIANDTDTEQAMQVIARPVCVEMCEYSLACGQIAESELGSCLNQCETDCTRLEALIPTRMCDTNSPVCTASAADEISSVSSCYLASACVTDLPTGCHPRDIGFYANTLEGKPNPTLNGTMGMSNCSMREDATTCESTISQNRNRNEAWSLTCKRSVSTGGVPMGSSGPFALGDAGVSTGLVMDASIDLVDPPVAPLVDSQSIPVVAANLPTAWACSCIEYGVQVATVTGTAAEDDPAFLELCWSEEQLACFYKGDLNCGKSAAGTGLL